MFLVPLYNPNKYNHENKIVKLSVGEKKNLIFIVVFQERLGYCRGVVHLWMSKVQIIVYSSESQHHGLLHDKDA